MSSPFSVLVQSEDYCHYHASTVGFPSAIRSPTADTAVIDPSLALDDRTEQFLAEKRRKLNSVLEDWDHEWAKLSDANLKGAMDAVKRHPQIGSDTHKAILSHFRNADLKAAFF